MDLHQGSQDVYISNRYFGAHDHIQARAFPPILILGLFLGGTIYYYFIPSSTNIKTLNDKTFVPYTIVARENVSPTSFILSIAPHHPNPNPSYLIASTGRWRHPLWSVEFKQPEVQIARHYTPLPPLRDEDAAQGRLRFYIRAVGDGEMSSYLSRLGAGQDVWLRGPHVGFGLAERLGDRNEVVFLAGGTGLAPGLQAAKAVLEGGDDVRVSLLWAIRERGELQSTKPPARSWLDSWKARRSLEVAVDLDAPSPVARQLKELKAQYGNRVSIQVGIDEEQNRFQAEDIRSALTSRPSVALSAVRKASQTCRLHIQVMHEKTSEVDEQNTSCSCKDDTHPGKNLFLVSGPDGFISHYAGPKVWLGGRHTQGPVGGIAAHLQRSDPQLAKDWLVLKL